MNTYSQKINNEDANKLKSFLEEQNACFDIIQYSHWRAKTQDYQIIYYTSGKILVQGKNIDNLLNYCNVFSVNNSSKEESIEFGGEKYIGTDESGKGDFFGPLVIAGVQVDKDNKQKFIDLGIKDSKKLDDKKILELAAKIKANAVHSVVVIMPKKYNELYSKFNNLNKLLAWGHARAIENILEKSPCKYAIADKFGDESLINNALMTNGKSIELKQMVRAEADIAVASASILARAEFVQRIAELEKKYELSFSKGASSKIVEQANIFIDKYKIDRLNEIAKMHFKTVNELKR